MKTNRILGILTVVLAVSQVFVVFISWLLNTINTDFSIRSLLSSEGIRWFCRTFVDNLLNPLLVWMILIFVAYGVFKKSGIAGKASDNGDKRNPTPIISNHFQRRHALRVVYAEIVLMIICMCLLVAVPHATLLNATGHLYPSGFSQILIPAMVGTVIICSLTYGIICGTICSLEEMYSSLTFGLEKLNKFIPIYILAIELYHSLVFILSF